MKKFLFGLSFLGSILFTTHKANAQSSFGGACCMEEERTCYHPSGITFADSVWDASVTTGC